MLIFLNVVRSEFGTKPIAMNQEIIVEEKMNQKVSKNNFNYITINEKLVV